MAVQTNVSAISSHAPYTHTDTHTHGLSRTALRQPQNVVSTERKSQREASKNRCSTRVKQYNTCFRNVAPASTEIELRFKFQDKMIS